MVVEKLFSNVYESISKKEVKKSLRNYDSFSEYGMLTAGIENRNISESNSGPELMPVGPQEEFEIQKSIRPIFDKPGVNKNEIGTHPDFEGLESNSKIINQYSCTLFVDIKGSTRLSLLMELDEVFQFKNSVIKTCIEAVRSFDGHVHRIMGDAVMAFFCGKDISKEDAVANALNCIATIKLFLENGIKPWLEKQSVDASDFGFRIGCDFGDDSEVLWGNYGYQKVGEVSATGLPVDMAAKLQGLAGKNRAMLGQGLLDFIDWPCEFSSVKIRKKGGENISEKIVTPNLTRRDGSSLNYQMRLFDYDKYMQVIAFPASIKQLVNRGKIIGNSEISFNCFEVNNDGKEIKYISASRFLDKETDLKFSVTASTRGRLAFPLKVKFIKTNHGSETPVDERGVEHRPVVHKLIKERINQFNKAVKPVVSTELSEFTLYRSLHTMKCEIVDSNNFVVFSDYIGVLIK